MRLFIALKLSKNQQHDVGVLQHRLKMNLKGVKWVKPENMHLTLKFLGEIDSHYTCYIKSALEKTLSHQKSFQLDFGETGVFPDPGKARVLWIGVHKGKEEAICIAEKLEYCLTEAGFSKETREFQPHLTIGRLRNPVNKAQLNVFLEGENKFRTSAEKVDGVVLFQSILDRHGARYEELLKVQLTDS